MPTLSSSFLTPLQLWDAISGIDDEEMLNADEFEEAFRNVLSLHSVQATS
jgi:hypothetical protein